MLDAATGKSVWASLGKHSTLHCLFRHRSDSLCVCTAWINLHHRLSLFHSCAEQHERILQRQEEPSCVQWRFLEMKTKWTVFCILAYSFSCFSFKELLVSHWVCSCFRMNIKLFVVFWWLDHCISHDGWYVMLCGSFSHKTTDLVLWSSINSINTLLLWVRVSSVSVGTVLYWMSRNR